MATILSAGDIAIVHYNTDGTDTFSFVFLRDVEAGTTVNFTDNGWLAADGFRTGEGTVTYTASTALAAGSVVTLTGLDLDDVGDQIIAYQGDPATPTILHVIDFADENNAVAGDATDDSTTALPPGFTLGVNAVAVAFDSSLYAGPISGSPEGLFAALNDSTNWLDDDALPVAFTFDARPIIDLDADNSTSLGRDYEAAVVSGGPAVPIADTDVAIDDFDDFDIWAAEVRVLGVDLRDLLAVNGDLPDGIVAIAYHSPSGILRLEGRASHADYEAAIRQVVFSTTDSPDDLKRIHVSVFDGRSWSPDGTAFIHVLEALTAAPPGLDLDANNSSGGGADATATYTAGGPAISVTDIDVTITDADSTTIESATITILGWSLHPGDTLSVSGSLPGGITASSYDPVTGVITLSGVASLADYQTALRQVVYSNSLATPSTADRGIQVTVNDGTLSSNLATMYMHVVVPPPNIAPVLDLDANNSTTSGANYLTGFTEGAAPVAIADADVSIIDSDNANLASATITLTNPQTDDILTFDGTPPAGIIVAGSGTAVITLTGLASSASYQTALQQIKFSNSSIDPSNVTRVIEVVVNDGASNSNTATTVVQVEAVNNSAPVIDLDPDDSGGSVRTTFRTAFTENGAPIPIADADTSITDLDSPTLVSATITLANRQTGDLLTATLPLPGGIVASAYDPGTGVLMLTGSATLDEYEAALRQILFSNNSDDPATVDRLIEVVVSDGANTSNVAAALISVLAVNDAPAIHVDTPATYFENAAASVLSPLATLADVDDAELNEVVVRITDGTIPGDGDTLTIGGLTGGTINGITFLWNPTAHAMVLRGASSAANYQDLLQTVGFHSTSDNPTDFNASPTRTLTWSVSDGTAVTSTTTTLNIVAVNDAPQATVAAAASYTENGAPVVLSPATTVTDVDDIALVSGEVRIVSGAVDGDLLTVNGLQNGTFSGIDFSYNSVLRSLTFTRPTAVADYEAFLRAIEFSSTSDNPTDSGLNPQRTLSWFVFDGDAISAVQTTILSITALADAPVNTVPGAQSVNEDTLLPIAGVLVTDADSATLTTTLTVTSGTLNVTGSGVSGNGTAAVTITGTAAHINAALAGLSYRGNLNFNGPDTLTVTTGDGTVQDIDTVAITVNPVNDPPTLPAPKILSINEDTTLLIPGVSVSDVDSLSLTTVMEVTDGIINVTTGTGATVDGNGTAAITITGTVSQTNAALAGLSYRGNLDFHGEDFLFLVTRDEAFGRGTTILVIVAAVNDAPANTVPAAQSVSEDETLVIAGVSVADVDGGPLTTTLTVTSGTLNVTGSGVTGSDTSTVTITGTAAEINTALASLSYVGNLDFNGLDTLTVTTSDGAAQDVDTVAITVNAVNDPPVNAVPGAQSVNEDTALPIAGVSVADVDAGTLTTTLTVTSGTLSATGSGVTGSGTGTVAIIGTAAEINTALASLAYLGNLDFNGPDTLVVTTSDGTLTDIDNIPITVNAVNDAPVNTVPVGLSVNEDTPLVVTGLSVTDVDSPTLTVVLTAANGTLIVTPGRVLLAGNLSGGVTITGAVADVNAALAGLRYLGNPDFSGVDTITIDTSDGALNDTDNFQITVNAAGDAPQLDLDADNSSGATGANNIALFSENGPPALLADTDLALADVDSPDLTGATFTLLNAQPGDALLATGILPGGINADFTGNELTLSGTASVADYAAALALIAFRNPGDAPDPQDRIIQVTVNDGALTTSAFALVQVQTTNDAPVAQDESASGNEDTPIVGMLVANDADSTTLTYALAVDAAHGTVVVDPDGSYTYTPDPDFNGTDSFTFTANDGAASSNTATVNLTVNPLNDPPLAQNGSASGDEDTVIAGTLNATDVDSATLTYSLAAPAVNGTVVVSPDGSFTYTPNADFNGTDSFTFTANDGAANSNIATVILTINPVDDGPTGQGGSGGIPPLPPIPLPPPDGGQGPSPGGGSNGGTGALIGFDAGFYLLSNPDVAQAGVDPLQHFNTFGWHEGRNPNAWFDTDFYLANNPDVAAAGVNPLEHFNAFGWHEARSPNAWFDAAGYLAHYADVAAAGVNPLQHYEGFGWREGRDPSVAFDTIGYLAAYPDVATAGVNPLNHFLQFGILEGRSPFGDGVWH